LLIVSHPIREGWTVVGKHQPAWRSRDIHRFEWKVPAGVTQRFDIVEERPRVEWSWVSHISDSANYVLLDDAVGSGLRKGALRKALEDRRRIEISEDVLDFLRQEIGSGMREQARARVNINTVLWGPASPKAYEGVQVQRVSVYNPPIHARFPLLGMKLENTTGQPLVQGPLASADGSAFAGDRRLPDLQPGEKRLLSYGLDLGLEVWPADETRSEQLLNVLIRKGQMRSAYLDRSVKSYQVRNRSREDRLLIVSRPIREGWTVVGKHQPAWRSRDIHRFEWKVPAGATQRFEIVEERSRVEWQNVATLSDSQLHGLLTGDVTTVPLKDALRKDAEYRRRLAAISDKLRDERSKLAAIVAEQARVRENINTVPKGSAPHKRYVATFDQLETALLEARSEITRRESVRKRREQAREDYLANLSVR
jgi:hypothetical protein